MFQACLHGIKSHRNQSPKHETKTEINRTFRSVICWFLQFSNVLGAPDIEIQAFKTFKNGLETIIKKDTSFSPRYPNNSQLGSRNPSEKNKDASLDHPKVRFLVLASASESAHGLPECQSGGSSLPNDTFWARKVTVSVSKIIIMG